MSLLHNWRTAYDLVVENPNGYLMKSNWDTVCLAYKDKHILVHLYSKDIYGYSYYHRVFDSWRKNRVQYLFHELKHFPMYYITRNRIFMEDSFVVDK